MTIAGDEIEIDFAGTSPQHEGNLNCPLAVTRSACYFVVRCLTEPDLPSSGGAYAPVHVTAPAGSLVNASSPAAVVAGNTETSSRIVDVVFSAFGQAVPVPAQGQGTMNNVTFGNRDFTYYETIAGGQGACPDADGPSAVHVAMSNTLNTPIEALELSYPLRVERYELRQGSGGGGAHRGGDGVVRELRVLEDCRVSLLDGAPPARAGGSRRRRGRRPRPQSPERGGAAREGVALAARRRRAADREPRRRGPRRSRPSSFSSSAGRGVARTRSSFPAHSGSHQFQSPASCMIDGTSSARMTVASKMIPAARPMPNCLTSTPGLVERTKNANISTRAALVTSFPVRARPRAIAVVRVAGLVVRLPHAADHEHLVVHRQPVEEREDHQRDPGDDRVGRVDVPDRLRAMTLLEDEDDDPERGAEGQEVEDDRLDAEEHRAERAHQQDEREHDHEREHDTGTSRTPRARSRGPPGAIAAERQVACEPPSSACDARQHVVLELSRSCRGPASRQPSSAGNASTSWSLPLRQPSGGGGAGRGPRCAAEPLGDRLRVALRRRFPRRARRTA